MSQGAVKKELLVFISKMNENEQAELLLAIKNRDLLKQAIELDSKQKEFNKGKKLPTMFEIVQTIAQVRNQHAKKAA